MRSLRSLASRLCPKPYAHALRPWTAARRSVLATNSVRHTVSYYRPGSAVVKQLQQCEIGWPQTNEAASKCSLSGETAISNVAGWSSEQDALLLGQDAAFAASLADRSRQWAVVLQAFRRSVD